MNAYIYMYVYMQPYVRKYILIRLRRLDRIPLGSHYCITVLLQVASQRRPNWGKG